MGIRELFLTRAAGRVLEGRTEVPPLRGPLLGRDRGPEFPLRLPAGSGPPSSLGDRLTRRKESKQIEETPGAGEALTPALSRREREKESRARATLPIPSPFGQGHPFPTPSPLGRRGAFPSPLPSGEGTPFPFPLLGGEGCPFLSPLPWRERVRVRGEGRIFFVSHSLSAARKAGATPPHRRATRRRAAAEANKTIGIHKPNVKKGDLT